MLYFDKETKIRLIKKFYDMTEWGGYLFIGLSESLNRDETPYTYGMPSVYRKGQIIMYAPKKIKVLVIDDSLIFRETVAKGISCDRGIEVVGTASDPFQARDKIIELEPDVLTLDIEMPKMSGISLVVDKIIQLISFIGLKYKAACWRHRKLNK